MAVTTRPKRAQSASTTRAEETFITGAGKAQKPKRKRKIPVLSRFDEAVLEKVDIAAQKRGISRSAWIQYVVSRALEQGEG